MIFENSSYFCGKENIHHVKVFHFHRDHSVSTPVVYLPIEGQDGAHDGCG